MEKSLTALMCAFIRTYYERNNFGIVENDILSEEEYEKISESLISGIKFFNPSFRGTEKETLNYIIYNHIGPSVLYRSNILKKYFISNQNIFYQYLCLAAGYDTTAKQFKDIDPKLEVFELDKEEVISDKIKRYHSNSINMIKADFRDDKWIDNLYQNGFLSIKTSLCSLLGFSYYVRKEDFCKFLANLNGVLAKNSVIIFDYQTVENSSITTNNSKLASGAKEFMKSTYSDNEIKALIKECGYSIIEFLSNKDAELKYKISYLEGDFEKKISAPKGIKYMIIAKRNNKSNSKYYNVFGDKNER